MLKQDTPIERKYLRIVKIGIRPIPAYNSSAFTTEWVRTTGVEIGASDPESPMDLDFSTRPSFEGEYTLDDQGRPLNPMGRQGLADRGDLAKWGPNNATNPIVVTTSPQIAEICELEGSIRRKNPYTLATTKS